MSTILKPRIIGIADAETFKSEVWWNGRKAWWIGDLDIDSDGGENVNDDPFWQPDTSLHHDGKPINALAVPGVVVPGWFPKKVAPIVLGCLAKVTNLNNDKIVYAVVHDTGPLRKVGEGTPFLAERLGINPNSVNGGEDSPILLFECFPGVPAVVEGVAYDLQPFR